MDGRAAVSGLAVSAAVLRGSAHRGAERALVTSPVPQECRRQFRDRLLRRWKVQFHGLRVTSQDLTLFETHLIGKIVRGADGAKRLSLLRYTSAQPCRAETPR
jgi:hypothetical protein